MTARGLSIAALGAVLAVLIALNVFRSRERASADLAGAIERADDGLAAHGGAPDVRSWASPDARADEAGTDVRGGAAGRQSMSTVPSGSGLYASISAALAEHDVPPERRMTPPPELLGTERAFAAESVDPLWSTAAESGVLGRIAEIPGLALVSINVECRTTLCFLQFVTPQKPPENAPNSVDIVKIARAEELSDLWLMAIRVRSGVPISLAYLRRVETAEAPASAAQ
jgi:hypothetical protein